MATHSSVLAWRIPGMAEPGGLPTMGSHRVGHNWSDLAAPGLLLVKHQLINIWLYLAKNISIHLFFLYTSINKLWCILELTLNLISKHFSIYIYLTSLSTLLRGASPKKKKKRGFPGGANGKEHASQCRKHKRCGSDPWVRKIPRRRAWQPTPVFLLGESHWQRSLAGYSPWGCKELDTTEPT